MLSFEKIRKGLQCCLEEGRYLECPYIGTVKGYCIDALKRDALEAVSLRKNGGGHTERFSDGWTPDQPLDGATVWKNGVRGKKV